MLVSCPFRIVDKPQNFSVHKTERHLAKEGSSSLSLALRVLLFVACLFDLNCVNILLLQRVLPPHIYGSPPLYQFARKSCCVSIVICSNIHLIFFWRWKLQIHQARTSGSVGQKQSRISSNLFWFETTKNFEGKVRKCPHLELDTDGLWLMWLANKK